MGVTADLAHTKSRMKQGAHDGKDPLVGLREVAPVRLVEGGQGPDDLGARLQRFVQDRTRMLAAISHDLRTPITSLRLRAEFIEDEEIRSKILETLDDMQRMAEEMLELLGVEDGCIHFEAKYGSRGPMPIEIRVDSPVSAVRRLAVMYMAARNDVPVTASITLLSSP